MARWEKRGLGKKDLLHPTNAGATLLTLAVIPAVYALVTRPGASEVVPAPADAEPSP